MIITEVITMAEEFALMEAETPRAILFLEDGSVLTRNQDGVWLDDIKDPRDIATAEEVKDFYNASARELSMLRNSASASGLLKPRRSRASSNAR